MQYISDLHGANPDAFVHRNSILESKFESKDKNDYNNRALQAFNHYKMQSPQYYPFPTANSN